MVSLIPLEATENTNCTYKWRGGVVGQKKLLLLNKGSGKGGGGEPGSKVGNFQRK